MLEILNDHTNTKYPDLKGVIAAYYTRYDRRQRNIPTYGISMTEIRR